MNILDFLNKKTLPEEVVTVDANRLKKIFKELTTLRKEKEVLVAENARVVLEYNNLLEELHALEAHVVKTTSKMLELSKENKKTKRLTENLSVVSAIAEYRKNQIERTENCKVFKHVEL